MASIIAQALKKQEESSDLADGSSGVSPVGGSQPAASTGLNAQGNLNIIGYNVKI